MLVALHYTQHIKDHLPSSVLATVKTALGPGAGAVRRNGQAVTMRFQTWPNVDVVPASQIGDGYGKVIGYTIPDMNRETWLRTNPPEHARRMADAAGELGPHFRRVVKMLKDWNRRQNVSLQSYHLEVMALKLATTWDDHSWPLYQWFQNAQNLVGTCWHDGQDVSIYLQGEQVQRALAQLQDTASVASTAWYAAYTNDHRQAIGAWRSVFGQRFPHYG